MLFAVCLVSVAAPFRQVPDGSPRQSSYLQLNAGLAIENFDLDEVEDATGSDIDVDESFIISGRFGRRFSEKAAGEIVFDWVDGFDLETGGTEFGTLDGWSISGNLKLYPYSGDVEPYAQLGLGVLSGEFKDTVGAGISEEESDLALRGGGGIDISLSPTVFFNLDAVYTLATGDLDEFDFFTVTAGVGFRL
jgi:opacity protein-like surface antigen